MIDLHIHSIYSSDGEWAPKEIIKMARDAGLKAVSITDHDTVDGVEDALYWGKEYGIEVLPGIEIYAEHKGRWLHILGYLIDWHNEELIAIGKRIIQDRMLGINQQIAKLREAGFYLEKEKVLQIATGNTPLYSAYSTAIFSDPRNSDNSIIKKYLTEEDHIIQFCKDYMVQGKTAFIKQYSPEASDVINIILNCGGIPILAHPGSGFKAEENYLIDELVELGMTGLEVYTSQHNSIQEAHYLKYVQEKGLTYTCGSDFHGKLKPHVKLGGIKNNGYEIVEKLKSMKENLYLDGRKG